MFGEEFFEVLSCYFPIDFNPVSTEFLFSVLDFHKHAAELSILVAVYYIQNIIKYFNINN